MTAALIEQDDIAAGTSSRSSRLIHGGLRYLEQVHLPLVREALAERRRLLRNAPHLVRLEPQLFPVYGLPFVHKAFYDAGLTLYDILGARHDGGWHRRLDVEGSLEIWPSLRREGCAAACSITMGSRTTRALPWPCCVRRSARSPAPSAHASPGDAVCAPTCRSGPARVVVGPDVLGGTDIDIRTRAIVDATGV